MVPNVVIAKLTVAQGERTALRAVYQPLQQTSDIAKVSLAPSPPTIGQGLCPMECARHPAPAPSRLSQLGFQYCSRAPQTGFQYCAVDSITTSSTCCWISHSANRCICSGLLPYPRRSNWYSSSTSTSATATASFFVCTSIPAILYGISSSSGRERRACRRLHEAGSRAIDVPTAGETTPIYSL